MQSPSSFPVRGIVGIVTGGPGEPEAAAAALARDDSGRPDALEVRADLFSPPQAALSWVTRLSAMTPVVFTARLRDHGGQWQGDETARLKLYRDAIQAGAALVDAEWDSPTARELSRSQAPLIASHHDFKAMPAAHELEGLTASMLALNPRAVKCVPTAHSQRDGVRMLEWTSQADSHQPRRLGFAMGEPGLPSRVLSISRGAPFTYGSMERAVAPGQVSVAELAGLYRARSLTRSSRVLGVVGNPVGHSLSPYLHNAGIQRRHLDAVYLPFKAESLAELLEVADALRLEGLSVTIPFKEEALRAASTADGRSTASGAANTLLLERAEDGRRGISAYNTDFDGVLGPLRRRGIELENLTVAILGNGGAARGAARALVDADARVTLFYRNPQRGAPVARSLGVHGEVLSSLGRGQHRLIINATPLGLHPGDVSPLPAAVLEPATIAFDMIYDPPLTPFLREAEKAGATVLIPGREMLISQALVQFRLFCGADATYEEFEAAFLHGQARRKVS